tara:strand:- start:631 stop:1026 length:396 start_codon:yes stop_codon:yes gene_type:complete
MQNEFFNNPIFILVVIAWTLPWKGIALWKSARNKQKNWFIALLLFNTLAVLEILYIFVFSKKANKNINKKQNKILELFKNKKKITNNDVEKLLRVSDATATNYLDALEKQDKIKQIGKTGRSVFYQFNGSN